MKSACLRSLIVVSMMLVAPHLLNAQSTPDNLTTDISWSPANFSTVADIQAAFNNARAGETTQLPGKSYYPFPTMVLPAQATWDAMSNSEKALWLINDERTARGVLPLEGVDNNVINVAQAHANFCFTANDLTHTGSGGTSPWQRLDANSAINGHHDFLSVAENLAAQVTTGTSIDMPVERAVYGWIYEDASSSWGHRVACLFGPFTNNHGSGASEGLMGIGRVGNGPWSGIGGGPGGSWPFAEITVFNVFDPDATYDAALPVQLSSLTGIVLAQNHVQLQWTTLSEVNNYGFFVERKQAGESEFMEVPNSFTPGHGTTIQPQNYSFTDQGVSAGSWEYRLRQVDLDGAVHFSDPIRVNVVTSVRDEAPLEFALHQNYPNPFNPRTVISYQLQVVSEVKLVVYDMLGREVAVLLNEKKEPGGYSLEFDASGLASGLYVYRMRSDGGDGTTFTQVRKLVLMK